MDRNSEIAGAGQSVVTSDADRLDYAEAMRKYHEDSIEAMNVAYDKRIREQREFDDLFVKITICIWAIIVLVVVGVYGWITNAL